MALDPDSDLVAHMALPIRRAIGEALREYNEMAQGPQAGNRDHRLALLASAIAHAAAVSGDDELIEAIKATKTFSE